MTHLRLASWLVVGLVLVAGCSRQSDTGGDSPMAGTARGIELQPEGKAAGIVLPGAAVASDQTGARFVWVLTPEADDVATVHRREVTVGKLTPLGVEVTSGVEPGELVAVAGVNVLRDGVKARVSLPAEDAR